MSRVERENVCVSMSVCVCDGTRKIAILSLRCYSAWRLSNMIMVPRWWWLFSSNPKLIHILKELRYQYYLISAKMVIFLPFSLFFTSLLKTSLLIWQCLVQFPSIRRCQCNFLSTLMMIVFLIWYCRNYFLLVDGSKMNFLPSWSHLHFHFNLLETMTLCWHS